MLPIENRLIATFMLPLVCIFAISVPVISPGPARAAEVATNPAETFDGKKSQWSGFDRYDFTCDGQSATVVAPKEAALGKPWLWRGEFFGAFATVDQALL